MRTSSTRPVSPWTPGNVDTTHNGPVRDHDTDAEYLLDDNDRQPVVGNQSGRANATWKTVQRPGIWARLTAPFRRQQWGSGRQHARLNDDSAFAHDKDTTLTSRARGGLGRRTLNMLLVLLALCGAASIVLASLGLLNIGQPYEEDFLPHWGEPGYLGEGLARYPTDFTRDVIPVPCHSHNDYWRRVPLYEAIHNGFVSVEADVWLLNGDLLVGHKESALTQHRTFRSMYVNPIAEILDHQNPSTEFSNATRNGVFDADSDQTLVLLVDFKTSGYETLPVVEAQLELLRSNHYLTYFNGQTVIPGQVTVVATGNAPFDMLISNSTYRDIFFDAPLDLIWQNSEERRLTEGDARTVQRLTRSPQGQGQTGIKDVHNASIFDRSNSYYASVSFASVFGWPTLRPMTKNQIEILRGQVEAAHRQGLVVRYWETPGWPVGLRNSIWKTLVEEGVDMLNADDLKAAAHGDWRQSQNWWFW